MLNWPKPGWLSGRVVISDFAMPSSAAASSALSCTSGGMATSNRLAGTRIVEPGTIFDDEQLKMEEMFKKDIKEDVYDKESALQFLARRKVIPNEIVCKNCELEATIQFISLQTADSDGYIWKCGGCGYSWTMRNGTTLPKGRASLQDILFKFCSIFDLKGRPTRERKIAIAASPYILSTTF